MRAHVGDMYAEIAILGSFGKHYDLLVETAQKFKENGFLVLVPKLEGIKESNSSFILLEGDQSDNPKELEQEYLKQCLAADIVYVCDKDGYIGTTVAFELGVLSSYGQEIYFMEKPKDELFYSMIPSKENNICTPDELIKALKLRNVMINAFYSEDTNSPFDETFSVFGDVIDNSDKEKINIKIRSDIWVNKGDKNE